MAEGKEKYVVEATTEKCYRILGRSRFDGYVEFIEATPADRLGKEYILVRFLYPNVINRDAFNSFFEQRCTLVPKLRELASEEEYYLEMGDSQAYLGFKGRLQDVAVNNGYDRSKPASYFEPIQRRATVIMGNGVKEFTRSYRKAFFLSLARGVRDLHRKGIVHGAISPFTVGVAEGKAWIGGFHAAFMQDGKPFFAKDGYGKPLNRKEIAFYSPELGNYSQRGRGEVNCQTDIFSLGLYLHWCLTGELPAVGASYHWRETSVEEDYAWKDLGEMDSLALSLRIRSAKLRELLYGMLRYSPKQRFTAELVCDRLTETFDSDFAIAEDDFGYEPYKPAATATEREYKPRVAEEERREEAPKKEVKSVVWQDFDSCPVDGCVWDTAKLSLYKSWAYDPDDKTLIQLSFRNGNGVKPIRLKTLVELLKYIVAKASEEEILSKQLFAGDRAVEAFCKGQVCDESKITGLEDQKTQVEDTCRQYAKQAFECACRYYLQIKKTQVALVGEEESQYEKAQALLVSLSEDKGEAPSIDGAFAEISAALESIKNTSMQTLPEIELPSDLEEIDEVSAIEGYAICDMDGILAQIDGGFDRLRQAIEESNAAQNKQEKLDEVFLINEMLKEQAQNWVDDHLETLVKSEIAATAFFLKDDYELWTACAEKLIAAMNKIDELELALETEKDRAAKEYWQAHSAEIFEKIRRGELPGVSEEIKRRLS